MNTLVPLFLTGSFLSLQETRTSMDEIEFQADPTTDYRVTCPLASEKSIYNAVNTLAPSFLIGSSSFLQVTRTIVKSWISSKFG